MDPRRRLPFSPRLAGKRRVTADQSASMHFASRWAGIIILSSGQGGCHARELKTRGGRIGVGAWFRERNLSASSSIATPITYTEEATYVFSVESELRREYHSI